VVTMKISDECDVKVSCLVEVYLLLGDSAASIIRGDQDITNSAFLPNYMSSCCRRMQSRAHCFVALLFPLVVKDQFPCLCTTSCSHARGLGIEPVIQGPICCL
jgi:hypothetical protein